MTGPASTATGRGSFAAAVALTAAALLPLGGAQAQTGPSAAHPRAPAVIARELQEFRVFGSVLYIAAHPDDENTQLITYLSRGRDYRTAYLSLTRGDGGQNLLGPEFGDLLGVIRTQELLAARSIDGGRQFFSRARDFGYSKDYRQTLTKWDHQQVLSDIVRVIRTFRPDVLITRFSPKPGPTHGHHTASAALALEAFRLAGDPAAFPEQAATLRPWQPRRILWNNFVPQGGAQPAGGILVRIDGTDPVTGASFATLAARSRSMHRTQGFANFSVAAAGSGPRLESFVVLDGEPVAADIMDGIDTTWARIPGGAATAALADRAAAQFDPGMPSASVPVLLELKRVVAALPDDPVVAEKRRLLDNILAECLGLSVEVTVSREEIVPGEAVVLHQRVALNSRVPVRWTGVRYPGLGPVAARPADVPPGGALSRDDTEALPASAPLSQPYWLREDGTEGMFRVDDPALVGLPENPPVVPAEDVFSVGGQTLVVRGHAVFAPDGAGGGAAPAEPRVIPPVALAFDSSVVLLEPGSSREIALSVTALRPGAAGVLRLGAPPGWGVSPAGRPFHLAGAGETARAVFTVTAPLEPGSVSLAAEAEVGGAAYRSQRVLIGYPHIPPQLLLPPARLRAVAADVRIRGRSVGYLPGSRDGTADGLREMGFAVTELTGADLTAERLRPFDAVVIGVRAFNTRPDLGSRLPALFGYAEGGGTVVEQYNTPGGLQTQQLAPFTLSLSRDLPRYRVTDEASPVTLLEPLHPAFNAPNRIGPSDFAGWVQERGLDFASDWDPAHFTPLLECSDPGEPPLRGGLLVARCGKGYFVYTGLSFFRQLPAGVPGAYRLFANLVSLGR